MDPERWRRVEDLFHRALTVSPGERTALIQAECAGDAELREEVQRLLAADERPSDLVDRLERGALRPPEDPMIGREVGSYRLVERIATGGMGVVYRAERTDGIFQREVAIKLIRIELATENLVRRFEFERRTLAGLIHPNIAQLHDGGTTADGRPYLVMEFVRGIPIDMYCEEQRSTVEDRLRLFVQVCRAVHFAHQNLVVHRDLKPSNILIDEHGVPKLLDFGIARLLAESVDEAEAGLTRTGGQILTPDYASPEQLTLGPVTTAMDVYSLGVVLYELLTGRLPFKSDLKSPVEWHRSVLERTPTRPSSTALWSQVPAPADPAAHTDPVEIAARRRSTPRTLRRRLRGDLDRIVLMALRKEPERRYSSAKDLADDLERHFSGHPVQARRDSLAYRTTKFVRRNRLAVGSAAVVLFALVFGIVAARRGEKIAEEQAVLARAERERAQEQTVIANEQRQRAEEQTEIAREERKRAEDQAQVAREERQRAEEQAEIARKERQRAEDQAQHARVEAKSFSDIADYLMNTFLTSSTGLDAAQLEQRRKSILLHAARLRRQHVDDDHLRANLLDSLGQVAGQLGLFDDAEALVKEALDIRVEAYGKQSLEYALSLRSLGTLHYVQGELTQAAEMMAEALVLHRRALALETHTDVASVANDLGACLRGLGRIDEAEALHREALALRRAQNDGSLEVAESLNNLAGVDLDRRQLSGGAEKLEEALAIRRRILGVDDPLTLQSMANLATTRRHMGETERAYELLAEAETGYRAQQADGEEGLARTLSNHAAMLIIDKRHAEAEPLLAEAREILVRRFGPDHTLVASVLAKQAHLQQALGRDDDARVTWQRVVDIHRAPSASPRALGQALYEQGTFLWSTGQRDEGCALLKEAIDVLQTAGAGATPSLANVQLAYGEMLLERGDIVGAKPHLEKAAAIFTSVPSASGREMERVRAALRRCDDER